MKKNNDELVKEHYKDEAEKHGASLQSTMEDEIVREREIELILNFFKSIGVTSKNGALNILDLGCGNGYALSRLSKSLPANAYWGLDFSEDLAAIAKSRKLSNCKFTTGDARSLSLEDNFFDVVYSERCLINILDWEEQKLALKEIGRILKPNGYYLMIECFTDGLENNNRARRECGLEELKEAYHNKYFVKELFFEAIRDKFEVIEPSRLSVNGLQLIHNNFLSSHYFISRILHALVTKGNQMKNTEFVKFFSFIPPVGNYSQIQAYILKKR